MGTQARTPEGTLPRWGHSQADPRWGRIRECPQLRFVADSDPNDGELVCKGVDTCAGVVCTGGRVCDSRACACPSNLSGDVCRATCPTGQVRQSSDCTCVDAGRTPSGAGHCTKPGASVGATRRAAWLRAASWPTGSARGTRARTTATTTTACARAIRATCVHRSCARPVRTAECVGRTAALCGQASDPTCPPGGTWNVSGHSEA